jgi:hypothetical protein
MRPCQHCGTALESNVSLCHECGKEQTATVGLTAPLPPRRKGGQPTTEVPTGDNPSLRLAFGLFLIGGSIALVLAAGYLGWLTFGPVEALIAAMIVMAVVGAFMDALV